LSCYERRGLTRTSGQILKERLSDGELPPKEAFYSKLNECGISDEDYAHGHNVWNSFRCKTLRDYHDLYNASDVLLLADIFENFRSVCLQTYKHKLDPAWYYSSPGLSWDAMLKMTEVELELLSDYDMLFIIKKGISGGISMISNRYGKENNKYMGEKFDNEKNLLHALPISMQTTFTVGQCRKNYQSVNLNG